MFIDYTVPSIISDIALENCLFTAVNITKALKINTCSVYGIAFHSKGSFSHPSVGYGKNVIIFGADLSSLVHANNRAKNIFSVVRTKIIIPFNRDNSNMLKTYSFLH